MSERRTKKNISKKGSIKKRLESLKCVLPKKYEVVGYEIFSASENHVKILDYSSVVSHVPLNRERRQSCSYLVRGPSMT